MNIKIKDCFLYLCTLFTIINSCLLINIYIKTVVIEQDEQLEVRRDSTMDLYSLELTPETFEYVCAVYQVKHPEIVYAQAQLESGYFTSNVYKTKNNFLGLYDSKNKTYYSYKHWSDCILKYKELVQSKWDGNYNYYDFLKNLPYAEDPNYVNKVKTLVDN